MATAIEYGLISALVGVAVIVAVTAVGPNMSDDAPQLAAEEPAAPRGIRMIGAEGTAEGATRILLGGCGGGYALEERGDGNAEVTCKESVRAAPIP